MKKPTCKGLIALCVALGLTAITEAVFLHQLVQANRGLLQWVAVAIVALDEERQAIAICQQARAYCESTQCL